MEHSLKKELLILSHMRTNARLKLTKISRLTGIPVSTIFDRVKAGSPFVIKHTTLIDFQRLGFTTRATIILRTVKEDREALHEYIMHHNYVNNAYRINNGYDFLIEGVFRHLKELEDFIEHMEDTFMIKAKQIYYIIDDLKRETFLNNPEHLRLILPQDEWKGKTDDALSARIKIPEEE